VIASATRLGSIIAEAMADAAQRIVSAKSEDEQRSETRSDRRKRSAAKRTIPAGKLRSAAQRKAARSTTAKGRSVGSGRITTDRPTPTKPRK
jgi:hypothetical protein